jgi:hypothetical protein
MAVMNMASDGNVFSESTRVSESDFDLGIAAGFDGFVTDDISGTSFSAPRIAWFLAAGEAVRTRNLDLQRWAIELYLALKQLRDPTANHYQKLLFNPVRYIQAQAETNKVQP